MGEHFQWSGARLTGYRKRRSMTQEQLATRVGLSGDMIRRYEKERSRPGTERWQQLCDVLDVRFMDLAKRFEDQDDDLRDALLNGPRVVPPTPIIGAWRATPQPHPPGDV